MGQELGLDTSALRVHTDPEAGSIARSVRAEAFTYGNDIYFAPGGYQPSSGAGQRVLAHELSHVAAQRSGADGGSTGPLSIGRSDDPAEIAADRSANRVVDALRRSRNPEPAVTAANRAPDAVEGEPGPALHSGDLRRGTGNAPTGSLTSPAVPPALRRTGVASGPAGPVAPGSADAPWHRPDPVLRRSTADRGVIRRFYALVDDVPVSGKIYGKVGGRPYEWIPGERDSNMWEESPILTGWGLRHLYQRRAAVRPVEVASLESGGGHSGQQIKGASDADTPKGSQKRRNGESAAEGLGTEDKKVVDDLVSEIAAGDGDSDASGMGPGSVASEVGANQIEGLVATAKQLAGSPEKAAETIAALDSTVITRSGRKGRKGRGASKTIGDAKTRETVSGEGSPPGSTSESGSGPDVEDESKTTITPFEVPSAQRTKLAKEWGLGEHDSKFAFAMVSQENFDFISALTAEQRAFLPKAKMRKRQAPSTEDIAAVRKQIEEKAQQESERMRSEEEERNAKEAAHKKRDEGARDWAKFKLELRDRVRERVEAEMPDYKWGTAFDEIIGATDQRIAKNPSINVDKQIKSTEKSAHSVLDNEKKRRDVAEAAKKYSNLADAKSITDAVMTDSKLPAAEFDVRASEARRRQRNPDTTEIWATMLQLRLYKPGRAIPFERLTPRLRYDTHYSVDLDGLTLPAVTDDTTAEQLLDALLGTVEKTYRLHVTLETGVERAPDKLALPHRYWNGDGEALYDLYFFGNRPRWSNPEPKKEAFLEKEDITEALDQAYTELRDRLLARAQLLLQKDCHPTYR